MKRIKQFILILILGLLINPFFSLVKADTSAKIDVYFFETEFCTHCKAMSDYLESLESSYPDMRINTYSSSDDFGSDLLNKVADAFDVTRTTPTVVIGGMIFIGYSDQIEADIYNTLERYATNDYTDVVRKIINDETLLVSDFDTLERDTIQLPIIGEVEVESLSLVLGAVVLGFVDGFNPCAMWVLIFLIGMLINMKDRKRMWIIGGTFLFTSAFVYFLIMVSWLQLAVTLSAVKWFRYAIALIAVGFGGYNIYQFIKNLHTDVGCEVTNEKQRYKIMDKIKGIVKNNHLLLALLGVIVLAVVVNFIELACSAGLPLLYTQILAYNDLPTGLYFMYIGIYILFFLIDDLIIFTIAMITMRVTGISNRYTKYSHIIGGLIMIIIGILLMFFPNIIMFNF